jgi:ribosome-binding protein aMBF1 (putative translation factor)
MVGPGENRHKVIEAAKSLGFVFVEESLPWREALPEVTDENLPGIALVGARTKEGVTQRRLAELTGIPQRHISEMENSKRTIGKERAKKLANVLNVNYKVFL